MEDDLADELLALGGGDPFDVVRRESEAHQRAHGCGLHHGGAPQLQAVSALGQAIGAERALDLGSGLGYSTLWIAHGLDPGASVVGIDDDPTHTARATSIAAEHGEGDRVRYETGRVLDVLGDLEGPFDLVHDDAWFARAPDHLDAVVGLLRPGGLLTMANWFLLVDAISGMPRNDWERFAGPTWAEDVCAYARSLADRRDLRVTWLTVPPIAFATVVR